VKPLLRKSLESGRVHSAYLLSGPGEEPRREALGFARALVCRGPGERPCEACADCKRSGGGGEPIALDGSGRRGPLLRHIGDHPDLVWVERGSDDTRVRIAQVRAVQSALRLGANEGGRRVAVFADADWLNQEAQNALLRLLEEPPPATVLVLVAASAAGLLATLRSRCQRVPFPVLRPDPLAGSAAPADDADPARVELARRFEAIARAGLPELLDWAEEYRGERAQAAEQVQVLLETGSAWLHRRVRSAVGAGRRDVRAELDAFRRLAECRRDLAQRNANPQMVAERALLAVREALS
jgi:DNA polymerase-3 subunit delta'